MTEYDDARRSNFSNDPMITRGTVMRQGCYSLGIVLSATCLEDKELIGKPRPLKHGSGRPAHIEGMGTASAALRIARGHRVPITIITLLGMRHAAL